MTDCAPWITFRPEIKVLDCSVRDGGLMNDSKFDDSFVKAAYETCLSAGIDYMEIGYKNSKRVFPTDKYGPWRHCDEEDLRRIVGDNKTSLKLSAMADSGGKSDWKTDILSKKDSVLDMIRVACYGSQMHEAMEMIWDAHEKGYETTCNIMAISVAKDAEIEQALRMVRESPVSTVVIVDSFGALYSEQIGALVDKYQAAVDGTGKEVGIHAHNNQHLAFAHTMEAIVRGVNRVDYTFAGLGRGGGNCCTELLLGFLRNPKYRIRPVWKLIEEHILDLQKTLDWGPLPHYIMTGQMNQHPRTAIRARDNEDPSKIVDFFDRCVSDV